ncbi:MAG: four helix bundle protein [Patescibacteria group bacterium]
MKDKQNNVIQIKSFNFSIRIIKLSLYLSKQKWEYIISKQIIRSGTSIGANIEEAIGGYSKKDFMNKISIAYKEARETLYWIKLLYATNFLSEKEYHSISIDCRELLKILTKILITCKKSKS